MELLVHRNSIRHRPHRRESLEPRPGIAWCPPGLFLMFTGGRTGGEVGLRRIGMTRRTQPQDLGPVVLHSEAFLGHQPAYPLLRLATGIFLDPSAAPTHQVIVATRRTEPV